MQLNTAKLTFPLCLALIVALALPAAASAASLTARPALPWPGASVQVQASGFPARSPGFVTLSGVRAVSFRADAGGRATVTIRVPGSVRLGTHRLSVRAGLRSVSTTMTVSGARRATSTLVALSGGQRILLNPARGAESDTFSVRAVRLAKLASVVVRFDGDIVKKGRTSSAGTFIHRGFVPAVARGTRYVRLTSRGVDVRLRYFVVEATTPPPGPPPPPPPPPPGADTIKPTVSITAPASGASFSGATTTVTADASDNVGVAGVQFRLDGNALNAEDTSAPYSTAWNTATASQGNHTLTAVARDAAGNTTTSAGVTVSVIDKTPPTVSITAPSAGSTISGNLVVRANATDNTGVTSVQFRRGAANLGAADTTAPYSTIWSTTGGSGSQTFTAVARDAAGNQATSSAVSATVNNANTRIVAAAGDIACSPNDPFFNGGNGTATACRQMATSNLLIGQGYTDVLTLGDSQYDCASTSDFAASFQPSWGRVLSIIHPATGNHEYKSTNPDDYGQSVCGPNAGGYFGYFGGSAGNPTEGYYSFDIGPYWHVVSLNTNDASGVGCPSVSCSSGSPQDQWLQQDLAASTKPCTLAIWHHPLFASKAIGSSGAPTQFWADLQADGAELILNGHVHAYERFNPQRLDGTADPNGIAQFIVGTGGVNLENPLTAGAPPAANSAATARRFGILQLTLRPSSYDFQFITAASEAAFTDDSSSGSIPCH